MESVNGVQMLVCSTEQYIISLQSSYNQSNTESHITISQLYLSVKEILLAKYNSLKPIGNPYTNKKDPNLTGYFSPLNSESYLQTLSKHSISDFPLFPLPPEYSILLAALPDSPLFLSGLILSSVPVSLLQNSSIPLVFLKSKILYRCTKFRCR